MAGRRSRTRRSRSFDRYLGRTETTILATRQHPFALVRETMRALSLIVPLLVAAWGVAGVELLRGPVGTWLVRAAFVVMLVLVARLAWAVLEWEFERVVITDEKVIHVDGVLRRRIASTPLAKVSEFTVSQSLLGRVFDFGRLVVDVPGGREQALHGLAFLPDPAGMYRLVSETARHGRAAEGSGIVAAQRRTGVQRREGASTVPVPRGEYPAPRIDERFDHTIEIPRQP